MGVPRGLPVKRPSISSMSVAMSAGTPTFREGKIERVNEWLAGRGRKLEDFESWFYSDSLNDLPLLDKVTHPVAVDPDATLRAHAEERGWKVISLRQ